MSERRHVVLWGPAAVGKTSVGRALARRLGFAFEDLDEAIERASGRASASILRDDGEAAFRALERVALAQLLGAPRPTVVAVGGGALLGRESRELALRSAIVVGLTAAEETLAARLAGDPKDRPLLGGPKGRADRARLFRQLEERRAAYEIAHGFVETDADDVDAIAARVAARLARGMIPLTVSADLAYSILVANGAAAAEVAALEAQLSPTRVFIVTDETVARLHLEPFSVALPAARVITLPPGEAQKNADAVLSIAREMVAGGGDRGALVVALGGGVVTDLAGFAASIFARGVRWIAVPTTVVGMVDAATGGKTGANLGAGKNLIGTFHHPVSVILDPSFSRTEDARAVRSGLAEAIKTAAVGDAELFSRLETVAADLAAGSADVLSEVITRSVAIKAAVVEADPREGGRRMILNFGHTLGHAIEAATGFSEVTHGEAVSIGMALACRVGVSLGRTSPAAAQRLMALLSSLGLPIDVTPAVVGRALSHLGLDKKRVGPQLRFVVLDELGSASVAHVTEDQLRALFVAPA